MIITYFTYLYYQQHVLMLIPTHTTFVVLTKSYWSVVPLVQKHALILTIHLQCVRCDVYRDASASLDLSGSPNMEMLSLSAISYALPILTPKDDYESHFLFVQLATSLRITNEM